MLRRDAGRKKVNCVALGKRPLGGGSGSNAEWRIVVLYAGQLCHAVALGVMVQGCLPNLRYLCRVPSRIH